MQFAQYGNFRIFPPLQIFFVKLIYSSSFRCLTLLASPTPKYCFKGVGEAGPKNKGEEEIEFLINFHAISYF